MTAINTLTSPRTNAQERAARALTGGGYAVEFQDHGYGQVSLVAATLDVLPSLLGQPSEQVDAAYSHEHYVRLRWNDGRLHDAFVNYDMGGRKFRSVRAALDEVLWW